MKKESEFCTCIVKSLNQVGIGYKIQDPNSNFSSTTVRCFDIIGRINDRAVYCEAKFNKIMSAFNLFSRIEDHQAYFLDEFSQVKDSLCYIALGVNYARADIRAYIFDWRDLRELYQKKFSIHAKYLEKLSYNKIHKGIFSFDNIITKQDLINIYGESIYD